MNSYDREEWPGFLSAIRAAPTDNLPRLVAADWLEENGEPERAEFVRRQCAGEVVMPRLTTLTDYEGILGAQPHQCTRGAEPGIAFVSATVGPLRLLTFHHGFVSRVRAPLAVLCGGECGRCDGRGWVARSVYDDGTHSDDDCPDCHGTGRTPGVLRELLRREPLGPEGIEVSDRRPWQNEDGSYSWWMMCDGTPEEPADLGEQLGRLLPKCDGISRYPTESAARLALSRAVYAMCSG